EGQREAAGLVAGTLQAHVAAVEVEQAEEVDEVRRDEAQAAQVVELVRRQPQRAQRVDGVGNGVDVARQVYALRAAAEAVRGLRRRIAVQDRLHHRGLVQVGVEQGPDHVALLR